MPYPPEALLSRRARQRRLRRRRRMVAAAAIALGGGGVVAALEVMPGSERMGGRSRAQAHAPHGGGGRGARGGRVHRLPPIRPPRPGTARVILHGPRLREIALTFDDGFCARCVARLVRDVTRTGAHVTFFPNGVYGRSWDPQAGAIRRLIARGQVAIGNHTFTHSDPATESPDALRLDLTRNEDWIERTFGVSSRPFFRPPYGAYDSDSLVVAGELGYTKVVTWSGTLADSTRQSIPYVIHAIKVWARPGAIILAHGNYPATSYALPRMVAILRRRHLRTVTLPELLGGA